MRTICLKIAVTAASLLCASAANAALVLSTHATSNAHCSAGVCSASAANAILAVEDVQRLLKLGDVTIKSDRGTQDIEIVDVLRWAGPHRLTLDAYHSIVFRAPVIVEGPGAVTLRTNHGGANGRHRFSANGKLNFWDEAGDLIVNGNSYRLVKSLHKLAKKIAENPGGHYALAGDIDASSHVPYARAIVRTTLAGSFDGLGHTISNLTFQTIKGRGATLLQNLNINATFANLNFINAVANATDLDHGGEGIAIGESYGTISGVTAQVNITATSAYDETIGAIVGLNGGHMQDCAATGTITTPDSVNTFVGGLAGQGGFIDNSHASVSVQSADYGGGLLGEGDATITRSYATGDVSGRYAGGLIGVLGGDASVQASFATGNVSASKYAGGLVGETHFARNKITDSYSTGSVTGGAQATAVGSFAGAENATVTNVYATGAVSGPGGAAIGGVVGQDTGGTSTANYWDLDTTGIGDPHKGAGNIVDDPGIAGLTDAQLKSGLPVGFDSAIWGQNPNINNGYPYLLANPPP